MFRSHILICGGTGCHSNNSQKIYDEFQSKLAEKGLSNDVQTIMTGCFGLCAVGPICIIYPEGAFYSGISVDDVAEIVDEHIVKGRLVERLLYKEKVSHESVKALSDTNFYKKQTRIALRNCGVIDPENIDEYIAYDGYQALIKALTSMTPQEVIDVIKASGLRGRGGGGFPTGLKWQFAHNTPGEVKYVCCNADEGDPGAFMDRSILEGDPHAVLEAMTIAGYAIGAHQGYIYVRAEYPIAVDRCKIAINQAREYGLLGKNILGT
ncbi:MAG: NADH-quinone oxidoreductase subunit F, partial [Clostridiales bacterium]|nr:NADH-quinone oxidoreductase subunit F [Clostridiales bacterium]